MSEWHGTESLERHNDSLDGLSNKRSANSLHSSREFRAVSMQIELQKNMLVDKNLSKGKTKFKKQKVLKCVAFLTGGEDWLSVNRAAKNTLVLIKVLRI